MRREADVEAAADSEAAEAKEAAVSLVAAPLPAGDSPVAGRARLPRRAAALSAGVALLRAVGSSRLQRADGKVRQAPRSLLLGKAGKARNLPLKRAGRSPKRQRQDTSSQNQASRQSTATSMQSTHSSTVTNVQSDYSGGCHDCSSNWDSGDAAAGFVVGALVGGAMVAAASQPAPTTTVVATAPAPAPAPVAAAAPPPPAPVAPPCNVAPIPVSGVPYYKCGATWYTAGYASIGVVYMPVPPPPGYSG